MQIGKIEFGLPAQQNQFYIAVHSLDMMIAIHDVLNEIRKELKYGENPDDERKPGMIYVRKLIIDSLENHGVNLDWLQ